MSGHADWGFMMCRFTRHINSSQFSGCPSKGHLLDRPATGRSDLWLDSIPHPLLSPAYDLPGLQLPFLLGDASANTAPCRQLSHKNRELSAI